MTITTRDQLINAMANNSSRIVIDKGTVTIAAGAFYSYWRVTGQPGQGAIPSTAAVCDHNLVGSLQFTQQTAPATSYLSLLEVALGAAHTLEVHDRLMHMGGLSGTVTTAQTVGINLDSNLSTNNLAARVGDSNYSDVQWWLEWYTATGSTAVTATVNVTYNDGSTGNLTGASLAATRPASFMLPLNNLIPAAASGLYIRGVNSVTLSATTGTAGSFGITATRYRAGVFCPQANARFTSDWASLGIPEIPNSSCLFPVLLTSSTTAATIRATGKMAHG